MLQTSEWHSFQRQSIGRRRERVKQCAVCCRPAAAPPLPRQAERSTDPAPAHRFADSRRAPVNELKILNKNLSSKRVISTKDCNLQLISIVNHLCKDFQLFM